MTKYLLALLSALLVANTFSAEYNVNNAVVDGSRRRLSKGGKSGGKPDDDMGINRFSGVAHASGDQERVIPGEPDEGPVDTPTTAKIEWSFDGGFTKMHFKIFIHNKESKTNQVHFHCAKAGQNGPIVAWFFDQDTEAPGEPTLFDGHAFDGYLTNDDMFEGIFCGGAKIPNPNDPDKDIQIGGVLVNNIAALYQAMKEGLIYLNVHTVDNGAGEVRGQIFVH